MILTKARVSAPRRRLVAVGMVLLALSVSGCSGVSEQTFGSAFVSPGKYEYHACQQIVDAIRGRRDRRAELEKLMAKASQGFGGELVSAIAYRTEYTYLRGDIDLLVKTSEEKQCVTKSPWSSERVVF